MEISFCFRAYSENVKLMCSNALDHDLPNTARTITATTYVVIM